MMKTIFYVLLLLPVCLFAQINESDTLGVKAKLALTGFWQGGNVETFIFRAKSDISFIPLNNFVFKTQNSYVYQAFGRVKADEDILSLNFLYLHPDRKIYPLVLGFFSTNFRREINFRYLLGGGVTFQLYQKEGSWFKLSISSEYEQTEFSRVRFNRLAYDGRNSINTFRGTLWVSGKYHIFNRKLIFSHESYFQPSLERNDNYRWQADIGLELPLWKYLNFKVNYLHAFESIVIAGQHQEDQVLSFGFTIKSF